METITVNSSNGKIKISKTGEILNIKDTSPEQCISNINIFNVKEFLQHYKLETMPDSIDILAIGYWYNGADGKQQYEEPAHIWREETKFNVAQELNYQQEMKDNVLTPYQKLEALRARLNGEWDNPQLLKIGVLNNIKNDLHTILSAPTTDLLINFYPQEAAIVWDAVEVHPVYEDGEGTAEVCEEGEQTFYSVYLHLPEGGINCIADLATKELAMQFAELIRNIAMYR